MIINFILIVIVLLGAVTVIMRSVTKKKEQKVEQEVDVVDDKTYTLDKMTAFVKKRLDEITKINLYDIGLSEEELKRRKKKKYELMEMLMIKNI